MTTFDPAERAIGAIVTMFASCDPDKQTSPECVECVATARRVLSLSIECTALAGLPKRRAALKKAKAALGRDTERLMQLLRLNPELVKERVQ